MNNNKELLISYIHKLLRKDPYINSLFAGVGKMVDDLEKTLSNLSNEFLFSTMTAERVKELEKELNYTTSAKTLEGKRAEIEARWKTSGKSDLELLQSIADAWNAETTDLSFIDGVITIDFLSGINADYDITGLRKALEEAKPAHLPLLFTMTERQQTTLRYGGAIEQSITIEIKDKTTDQSINDGSIKTAGIMGVAERYEL
jgi:hypothetical protein